MCARRYAERPKQELVRLDAFEILWSPLTAPVDYAADGGAAAGGGGARGGDAGAGAGGRGVPAWRWPCWRSCRSGRVWLPVTYFCLWMNRLMGWMPELGHCVVCGLDLRGGDGVVVADG